MTFFVGGCWHWDRGDFCVTDLEVCLKGWESRLCVHNIEGDRVRWRALVPIELRPLSFVSDLKLNSYSISIRLEVSERGRHFICNAIRINCYKWRQCRNRDKRKGSHPWVLDQSTGRELVIEHLFRCNAHRWKGRGAKAWVDVSWCWRGSLKLPFRLLFYFRNG